MIGFGSILFAASTAETNGLTSPTTLTLFGVGIIGLILFAIVELFVVKEPMLNLRLFKIPTFTNATLVGYVATSCAVRRRISDAALPAGHARFAALDTGFVLLAVALASGITTPLAGRLYDKIGPRPLVVTGFALLCINTWQLAQIQALTPIRGSYSC